MWTNQLVNGFPYPYIVRFDSGFISNLIGANIVGLVNTPVNHVFFDGLYAFVTSDDPNFPLRIMIQMVQPDANGFNG
jgi:hypothetical protein